ncbi:MAG: maleate cis-trans isomerase family protein [Geminicoccales bacterium]
MRLGLLIPSSNVVLEPLAAQLQARRPEISVHVSRLGVLDVKLDAASRAQFEMERQIAAANLLCDAKVDQIIWGGTSASWLGIAHDETFTSRVEQETGITATTCVLEINRHLAELEATRLGMVTPYTNDVSAQINRNYAEMGFEVIASCNDGGEMSNDFAAIQPTVIERMIRDVAAAEPEAIIVMCTNVAAAALATELTATLGIPVLDSAAITLGLD